MAVPPDATFPVPPPVPRLPIVDQHGFPTPSFQEWCQLMWTAIQGGGGSVDKTIELETLQVIVQTSLFRFPVASVAGKNGTVTLVAGDVGLGNVTNKKQLPLDGTDAMTAPLTLKGYTVATLPAAGTIGRIAYVTDALAPTFLVAIAGGGAVKTPVFDNGANWVSF